MRDRSGGPPERRWARPRQRPPPKVAGIGGHAGADGQAGGSVLASNFAAAEHRPSNAVGRGRAPVMGAIRRDAILATPRALELALFLDFAQRAGMSGVQNWLSFYFKSPMVPPQLYPERDIFLRLTQWKNTLRRLAGEQMIARLGLRLTPPGPGYRG